MDINRLRPVRISTNAKDKIVVDLFPELVINVDIEENAEKLSGRDAPLHCGALCLYASLLMNKLYETDPWALEPYCEERSASLFSLLKADSKFANQTDEDIKNKVDEMLKVDIRNCFAHGNFEISYDVYTKRMYFVLNPKRFDYVTPEPIVIDKNSIIKANKKYLADTANKYLLYSEQMLDQAVTTNLSDMLKKFIFPTQLQKIALYYLEKRQPAKSTVMFDQKIAFYAQYVLASAKITYEQQEYYDIFGRDSSVFKAISLIRNSLAHDNTEFLDNAKTMNYVDKRNSKIESIAESASKLMIVDSIKQAIQYVEQKNEHSQETVDGLKEKMKEMFDFFFDGTNKFEDIAQAFSDIDFEETEGQAKPAEISDTQPERE